MKLLERAKYKMTQNENGENLPYLEITEVETAHYIIVSNDYQPNSTVLFTSASHKLFGNLLHISPKNFKFLKTFDSKFSYIEVWSTDQNSKPLEIVDKKTLL